MNFLFSWLNIMESFWYGEEMVKNRLMGHLSVKSGGLLGLSLVAKFLLALPSSWWVQVYFDLHLSFFFFFYGWNSPSFSLISNLAISTWLNSSSFWLVLSYKLSTVAGAWTAMLKLAHRIFVIQKLFSQSHEGDEAYMGIFTDCANFSSAIFSLLHV